MHFGACQFDYLAKYAYFVPKMSQKALFLYLQITPHIFKHQLLMSSKLILFRNLRRIHGKTLLHGQYALSVYTDRSKTSQLRSLCLNSLQQIDRGMSLIYSG